MRIGIVAPVAALVTSLFAPLPVGPPPTTDATTSTTSATSTTTTTPPSAGATPDPVPTVAPSAEPDVAAAQGTLTGRVLSGATPLEGYTVTLYVAGSAGGAPVALGSAVTDAAGAFGFDPTAPVPANGVAYLVADSPADVPLPAGARTLTSVLGVGTVPGAVVVNELTTVATAYAMAQFIGDGTAIGGPSPGLQNAAGMAHNLAEPELGGLSVVLATAPNGDETSTRNTFHSLANTAAACVATAVECEALFTAATTPEGEKPENTFRALVNIAQDPWHNVDELFVVSELPPAPYQPARDLPPPAWTVALRFHGDGMSLDGPGNFAIDHEGNIWVNNNYEFSPDTFSGVCGSDELFKFTPTGRFVPGSPYRGGGLSGAGYGIDVDPFGDIWVGNYGFASPAPHCPEEDQPPHNSVSQFRPDGIPVSPSTGFTQGGLFWPQATVSDEQGNLWIANCGDGSVTLYPQGDPGRARNISGLGLTEAFGIAHNDRGVAFITGIGSSTVAMVGPDGKPLPGSPISGPFLHRPMGIAADSNHNFWIANSGAVDLPCPGIEKPTDATQGSVGLLGPDGTPLSDTPFQAGGVTLPWGIAVDGNDNVWVANFAGKRVSQFCGVPVIDCRPGTTTGAAISPDVTGYGFDGLVRNTGVAIDPSGNVWLTNNWKESATIEFNPGGYEIVAFVGMAGPVQPPAPRPRPPAPSSPSPPQVVFAG